MNKGYNLINLTIYYKCLNIEWPNWDCFWKFIFRELLWFSKIAKYFEMNFLDIFYIDDTMAYMCHS